MKIQSTLMLGLAAGTMCAHAGRFQQFTERFVSTPDQAEVKTSSYLGGGGTEWLVDGGFREDGMVVMVGVALGPELTIGGSPAKVIGGRDEPAPEAVAEWPVELDGKGNPKKNRDGSSKPGVFSWEDPRATAFVAVMHADQKTVLGAVRLPWGVAGATSAAVAPDGAVYLAGPADAEKIGKLGAKRMETPALETKLGERTVYVARLSPTLDRFDWIHYETGPSADPEVRLGKDGNLRYRGVVIRKFDPAGELVDTVVVPTGLSALHSVSPIDGKIARGGEHHWPTGREPWRCPVLNIHEPDGELLYQFYDWGGPLVGLDGLRLVSDSAIRTVAHDDDGNLVIGAWSDGGNSVMYREPFDVRTHAPGFEGLGMSAWGAGVLSCAYLLKIEPETYRVSAGTLWVSFLEERDKPNSLWVESLGFAGDGSIAVGGKCASSLIQTGNHLNGEDNRSGSYFAVFREDLTGLRFSSIMNACGKADLGYGRPYGFASGVVGGRHLLLALTAAAEADANDEAKSPAPSLHPAQAGFGGGFTDGHFTILDLGPAE